MDVFFPDGGSYLKDPDMSETNPGEKPYNPILGSRDFSTIKPHRIFWGRAVDPIGKMGDFSRVV